MGSSRSFLQGPVLRHLAGFTAFGKGFYARRNCEIAGVGGIMAQTPQGGGKAMRILSALLTLAFVSCAALLLIFTIFRSDAQSPRSPAQTVPPDQTTTLQQQPVPRPKTVEKPLSSFDEYVATMLRFQFYYDTAYHAGLCRVRSDVYFNVFRLAQVKISFGLAQKLGLSRDEMSIADREVNRQFAKAREGVPEFDIIKGCEYLRTSPSMDELDSVQRSLTGNYH
jgi:hypothetical protein